MKIICNNFIPFKGFRAINLFGILFVRNGVCIDKRTIRHEMIHTAQIKEMYYILFYVWYFIEWLIRLFVNKGEAYRNISFESEAYFNENDLLYLSSRKRYAFIKYLRR